MERNFDFWLPIHKSGTDPDGYTIEGVASTDDIDLQGERVDQRGIDCEPLLRTGYLNWNHGSSPKELIGYPLVAEIVRSESVPALAEMGVKGQALWLKSQLLKGHPMAEEVRSLIKALEGTPRQLGFSIQGRIRQKEGDDILRCELHQMALTHEPVNPMTFAQVAKSLKTMMRKGALGMDALGSGSGGEAAYATYRGPEAALGGGMTTTSAAPLLLEDLGLARPLLDRMYGKCHKSHYNHRGDFRSVSKALEHLTVCKGESMPRAHRFLKAVITKGFDRELKSLFKRHAKELSKYNDSSPLRSHMRSFGAAA